MVAVDHASGERLSIQVGRFRSIVRQRIKECAKFLLACTYRMSKSVADRLLQQLLRITFDWKALRLSCSG